MGAEHNRGAIGHLVQLLHENRALGAQAINDKAVMHDLVPDIDRRAIARQGPLDDLDRAVDPGAEAAWGCQEKAKCRFVSLLKGRVHVRPPSVLAITPLGQVLPMDRNLPE